MSETLAVITRDSLTDDWRLQTWASRQDVAENCARWTARQEARLGNAGFEAKVLTEADYDQRRFDAPGLFHASSAGLSPGRPLARSAPVQPLPRPVSVVASPKIMIKVKR